MKKYFQIGIRVNSQNESEILISTLSDIGFYAFEEDPGRLLAYIKTDDFKEKEFYEVISPDLILSTNVIEDKNWNAEWERDYKPVLIGDFAMIRAPFHKFQGGIRHDLLITPKMSFGTGHHATTWLMISQMESIGFSGKHVLDFGTGTGVLAILAEKCGASDVLAIDIDEWSVRNAQENIEANGCTKTTVIQKSNLQGLVEYDIVLANINLNILTGNAAALFDVVKRDGLLLMSGSLVKDEAEMVQTFSGNGFQKIAGLEKDGWACISFQKTGT